MQGIVCVVAITLAVILLLIKIPRSSYTKRLSNAKAAIVASYLVCGFMMIFSIVQYPVIAKYEVFATIAMLVTVLLSSLTISYAMITILDEDMVSPNVIIATLLLAILSSLVLIESAIHEREGYLFCLIFSLVIFSAECVYYIIKFDMAYKKSLKVLNAYYDEEENHKIRWIRFCYIIAMLTNTFFIVYLIIPQKFMRLYMAWYIIFMLYFAANFISFLGSHKIVLDAFAHRALAIPERRAAMRQAQTSKVRKEDPALDTRQREKDFRTLAANLTKWVDEKKYREYDKTREQIASELGTTKEILQLYFATVIKKDLRSWRTELRINDAKKMLLEDRKASPQLVGEACGFSDRSNFHTTFVKLVGCTPKEWRKQNEKPGND